MANFSQVLEELSGAGYTEAEAIQATVTLAKIPSIDQLIRNPVITSFIVGTLLQGFQPTSEQQRIIVESISRFSLREKQCYFMHTVDGMSMGNIAKELEIGKGAVQRYIERARKKIEVCSDMTIQN